jgi:predicted GNAT superfamily acetyltransferase
VGGVTATIRVPAGPGEMRRLAALFDEVWGATTPLVSPELLRAIEHAGGYVAAAILGDHVVGGSFGFLARHEGTPALHSHITGVLPAVRQTGLGRALKLHQRVWAADHGLAWVTWTFDPLVRRNAWFNLEVLGAEVHRYLVDFYGPIDDAINTGDESDRLLVVWSTAKPATKLATSTAKPATTPAASTAKPATTPATTTEPDLAGTVAVATPDDVVALRRTDPAAATTWRRRVRTELGDRLAAGGRVVAFTRDGEYLVRP